MAESMAYHSQRWFFLWRTKLHCSSAWASGPGRQRATSTERPDSCVRGLTWTTSADFFYRGRHRVLGDAEDAGGIADAAAVEGHVHDGLLDPGFIGPVGVGQLERPPALVAAAARVPALTAMPFHGGARTIFAVDFLKNHEMPRIQNAELTQLEKLK